MKHKRYILVYRSGGVNLWSDYDDYDLLIATMDRCDWIKEYEIIDTYAR